MNPLSLRTLVLNADFQPLNTYPLSLTTAKEAITTVVRGRAIVVEEWPHMIRSPTLTMYVPKVIANKDYHYIDAEPKFCRRSIFRRDKFRCQYCGNRFTSDELTFDHVIPRSLGGKTEWTNILTACVRCNTAKKDKLPNYSGSKRDGLRPLKKPKRPTAHELLLADLEFLDESIKEDFGSWLYWNVELQE